MLTAAVLAVAVTACGGSSGASSSSDTPAKGGDLTIVRALDSKSMDNTMTFDNSSIWVFEQMMEMLYTVTPDGKDVKPWLAKSYTLSEDKLKWTFTLRTDVKFSNGQPMTSADVKFSLDKATNTKGGWEFINAAIARVDAPDPTTVVVTTKYPWAPLARRSLGTSTTPSCRTTTRAGAPRSSTTPRSGPARSSGTTGPRAPS